MTRANKLTRRLKLARGSPGMNARETNGVPRFGGQCALVVGAAHGIGKAIAVRLGREGADVVIADIDSDEMDIRDEEMSSKDSKSQGVSGDVGDSGQVQAAIKQVIDCHGRIDILMQIAGI